MSPGIWALLIALAATAGIGLVWRAREGRVRQANNEGDGETLIGKLPEQLRQRIEDQPGDTSRVTLLQLSTTFCAPCRHTRILLDDFAKRTDGVRHVEVDLTHHPEWSTPLRVHRTPTTLVLDNSGRELFRVGGVPRRDELAATIDSYLK